MWGISKNITGILSIAQNIVMDLNNVMLHESFASHILIYCGDLGLVVPTVMNGENGLLVTYELLEFKIS